MNLQDFEIGMWILLTLGGTVGSVLTLRLLTNLIRIQLSYPNHVKEVVEMSRHERRSEFVRFISHFSYFLLGIWVFISYQASVRVNGDVFSLILIVGYASFSFNTINEYVLGRKLYVIRESHVKRMVDREK